MGSTLPDCPAADYTKKSDLERHAHWDGCYGKYEITIDPRFIGDTQEGQWEGGWLNGSGVYQYRSGDRYEGSFKNGSFHGQGVYFFNEGESKGDRYVGEYRDDRRHGQGIYIRATGEQISGIFLNGKFVENAEVNLPIFGRLEEFERRHVALLNSDRTIANSLTQAVKASPNTTHTNAFEVAQGSRITSASEPKARRLALVVGNDKYLNVPTLDNAVSDASAIGDLLKAVGYEVMVFHNLSEKQFKSSLRKFKQSLKGGEEVVFFYAGHGVQLGAANYLLPVDVGADSVDQIEDEGIPLQRVLDDFSESKVKFSLALLDACRDNPFKSNGRAIGGRGLAPTSAATGQMIIFSAGAGQQALDKLGPDDTNKNGLFTRVLIEEVRGSNRPIHLLMRDVRSEVAKLAQDMGHQQVPAIYDQVIGDFYFKQP